jgi:hypothetical protein
MVECACAYTKNYYAYDQKPRALNYLAATLKNRCSHSGELGAIAATPLH